MKYFAIIILTFSMSIHASDLMDNYYSNDINTAVNTARERPHHYDYSTTYRYKRTTAQSIELQKLNLNELDDTRLKMDSQQPKQEPTVNGETNNLAFEQDKQLDLKQNQAVELPSAILPKAIDTIYGGKALQGEMSTQGIVQAGSITSTPRP